MLREKYSKGWQSRHPAKQPRNVLRGLEKRLEELFADPWGSSIATFCGLTSFVMTCSKHWGTLVNVIDPNLTEHFGLFGSKVIEYTAVYGISGLLELGLTIPATSAVFRYYRMKKDQPTRDKNKTYLMSGES